MRLCCVAFSGGVGKQSQIKRLTESCKKFGVTLHIPGTKSFSWREKVQTTRDFLVKLRLSNTNSTEGWNGLVIVCDAFDVRFLSGSDEIINKYYQLVPGGDKIIFTGEREQSHQSDVATRLLNGEGVYMNFSSCMFIGLRSVIVSMLNDVSVEMHKNLSKNISLAGCRCGPQPKTLCDQWYIGQWVSKNLNKAVIDTGCLIFWSTRGENRGFMEKYAESVKDQQSRKTRLLNKTTKTQPCVLHTPAIKKS